MKTHPQLMGYIRRLGILAAMLLSVVSARANPIELPEKSITPEVSLVIGGAILLEVICIWLVLRRARRPRFFVLWLAGLHLITYPAFLGVRFAESSRAIIIETPNRKLTVGQPLVYRLWVCNDLPQPMEFRLEHAVRKDEIFINHANAAGFMVKGSEARLVDRFKQSTDSLAPGTYTIDATLRDQTGNLLHHMKETVELSAPKSP